MTSKYYVTIGNKRYTNVQYTCRLIKVVLFTLYLDFHCYGLQVILKCKIGFKNFNNVSVMVSDRPMTTKLRTSKTTPSLSTCEHKLLYEPAPQFVSSA